MGFGAKIVRENERNRGNILDRVQPEDLLNFGFIPEFIGRLPVIAPLHDLNEDTLIRILNQPKNALIKQFEKMFEMEGVYLRFTDGALKAIVGEAMKRRSGARGLRTILEACLLETMYELPSLANVKECTISEEVILKKDKPILIYESVKQHA